MIRLILEFDLDFLNEDLIPVFTIIFGTVIFGLYWAIFTSKKIKEHFYSKYSNEEGSIKHILFLKYLGFTMFGLIPGIIYYIVFPEYSLPDLGLGFDRETALLSVIWIAGIGGVIIIMNWFAARRDKIFKEYPQIRVKEWDRSLIFKYSSGWIIYLLGYEFLFRAILLIPLVDTLGVWPGIAVNVAIYTLSHVPQGMDAAVGSFLLGVVVCLITLQTHMIWAAFLIHICFALSNSLVALKFHPEFRIVKGKRRNLEE